MDPPFIQYAVHFLSQIVNGTLPTAPRDQHLEEQVVALMTDHYRQMFGPANDPCFMILDNAQPIGHKRVYQAPFSRQRYGELVSRVSSQGRSKR